MRAGEDVQGGYALILAVVVVTLLAVAGLELSREVRLSVSLASNFKDRTLARMKALDGLTLAAKAIVDDDPAYDSLSEDWAALGAKLKQAREKKDEKNKEAASGGVSLDIRDLGGRLNLGLLVDQKGRTNALWVGVFKRLLEVTGNDPDLLPALLDWLDKDSKVRTGGAEEAEYQALGKKYKPRNGPLLDMDELVLVRGFVGQTLDGGEKTTGLAGLVTVVGGSKINVNTAPLPVLRALDTGLRQSLAQAIVELREERPIRKLTELRGLVGMSRDLYRAISPMLDVKSDWFEAECTGVSGRSRYRIRALIQRDKKEVKVSEAKIG